MKISISECLYIKAQTQDLSKFYTVNFQTILKGDIGNIPLLCES